jgi:hypothetical protein
MTLKPNILRSAKSHDDRDELEKEKEVTSWYKEELATTTKGHTNEKRSRGRDSRPGLLGLLKG